MKLKSYFDLIADHPELFRNEDAPLKIIMNRSHILDWQMSQRRILSQAGLPIKWAEIGIVLEDPYIIILRDLVEFPDGSWNGFVRMIPRPDLKRGIGIVVVPIYKGKVILLNHFRHSTRQWHFELPRGYGEADVSPQNNALRELEEELGANTSELVSLGSYYPETGFESQRAELFLAKIDSLGSPETNEGIVSFVDLSVNELEDSIANGIITDGFTISAYARAKLKGLI